MIPILKFENFAPDAVEVRQRVITRGFTSEVGPDGATYTGISQYPVPHWFERISELVNCQIEPSLSCFRLNLKGEMPHSWVHSDDICAKYASVLYLNPPEQCQGGTAFWKHEALGLDRLPADSDLEAQGIDREAFHRFMTREWKDLTFWKEQGFVPMQFNRFITYPTCLFHSRFPFEAFGSGPEDGRLIWVCFYNRKEQ